MGTATTWRPLIKWPGGKRHLIPELCRYVPTRYNNYFEPFFGGGALFFALQPPYAVLADVNHDLINFYQQFIHNYDQIIKQLKRLRNDATTYYKVRGSRPTDTLRRAVRFFYLNRTCFNGLYRTNQQDEFNVPFANNRRAILMDPDSLRTAIKLLTNATFLCQDFEITCSMARRHDLVYLDPPYTLAHGNNGFLRYNASLFTWRDQIRLRDLVLRLSKRGVNVILTNAAHPSIQQLYRRFNRITVSRPSRISARPSARRQVTELIITNF